MTIICLLSDALFNPHTHRYRQLLEPFALVNMERHKNKLNTICVSPSVAGVGLNSILSLTRRGHNNGRTEEQNRLEK